jgi:hypothetical protein
LREGKRTHLAASLLSVGLQGTHTGVSRMEKEGRERDQEREREREREKEKEKE